MPSAPFINADNASALALKRWEVCPTHAKPEPAELEHDPAAIPENPIESELACVREQLKALNEQIDGCSDAEEWDRLTRSKERLFRIWARLAQLPMDPKPAVVRQARQTQDYRPTPTIPAALPEQTKEAPGSS